MAADIGKVGTIVAILTFLALVIRESIDIAQDDTKKFISMDSLSFLVDAFMIGVTIIVVAVPEVYLLSNIFRVYH